MTSSSQPPPTTPARPISARNATAQPAATTANPDLRAKTRTPGAVHLLVVPDQHPGRLGALQWQRRRGVRFLLRPRQRRLADRGATQRLIPAGLSLVTPAKMGTRAELRRGGIRRERLQVGCTSGEVPSIACSTMSCWKLLRDKTNDEATGAYPPFSRFRAPSRHWLTTVPRCAPTTRWAIAGWASPGPVDPG